MCVSKHYISKRVLCPYYKCEGPKMIYCEGVADKTALHLAFASKTDMKSYLNEKCECDYKSCMICQMLNRKYDYE